MKPHKHSELIKAWADGCKIEYYSKDYATWSHIPKPSWSTDILHRIKPEHKPDVVMYAIVSVYEVNIGRRTIESDEWASLLTDMKTSDDIIKLTFDGETGKLKSAEVIHD
jgi:hypothetical protein